MAFNMLKLNTWHSQGLHGIFDTGPAGWQGDHTVADSPHGVLPHTETDVALAVATDAVCVAGLGVLLEVSECLQGTHRSSSEPEDGTIRKEDS